MLGMDITAFYTSGETDALRDNLSNLKIAFDETKGLSMAKKYTIYVRV